MPEQEQAPEKKTAGGDAPHAGAAADQVCMARAARRIYSLKRRRILSCTAPARF